MSYSLWEAVPTVATMTVPIAKLPLYYVPTIHIWLGIGLLLWLVVGLGIRINYISGYCGRPKPLRCFHNCKHVGVVLIVIGTCRLWAINYEPTDKFINSSDYNLYIHCCCWRFGNRCCLRQNDCPPGVTVTPGGQSFRRRQQRRA